MDKFQNSPNVVTSKETKTGGGLNLGGKRVKPNRAGPLVQSARSGKTKTQEPRTTKTVKTAKESKKRDTSNEAVYIESSAPREAPVSKRITRQSSEKEILDTFQNNNVTTKEWEEITNQVLTRGVQNEPEKLLTQKTESVDNSRQFLRTSRTKKGLQRQSDEAVDKQRTRDQRHTAAPYHTL